MTATMTQEKVRNAPRADDSGNRQDRRLLVGYLHKTSNTLCGIKGYASLIADRGEDQGETGQWARKIIAEVERMEEIFRSVGDMTRGRQHPDIGVDLPGLVRDLAGEFSRTQSGLNLRVGFIPEGELRLPVADLILMISEILHNSAESGLPGIESVDADIRGERDAEGRIFLILRDEGSGMDQDLVRQVASPFVTTREGHHGVGLTRVDTLMEMYGLAWTLESEPGRGTRIGLEIAEVY